MKLAVARWHPQMSIAPALHSSRGSLPVQDGRRPPTVMQPGAAGIAKAQGGVGVVAAGLQRNAAILVPRGVCPLRIGGGSAVQPCRRAELDSDADGPVDPPTGSRTWWVARHSRATGRALGAAGLAPAALRPEQWAEASRFPPPEGCPRDPKPSAAAGSWSWVPDGLHIGGLRAQDDERRIAALTDHAGQSLRDRKGILHVAGPRCPGYRLLGPAARTWPRSTSPLHRRSRRKKTPGKMPGVCGRGTRRPSSPSR